MSERAPDPPLTQWIASLKAGDPEAARKVWERTIQKLVALARARLRTASRAAADEEDVALSAFNSFFNGVKQGRFPRLEDRGDLWQVLLMLVQRKAVNANRHDTRAKRGGGKVVNVNGAEGPDPLASIPAGDPTPEAAACVAEECARLLEALDDPALREIALWKMEGYTNKEIAQKIGFVEGTVERKLKLIRDIWKGEVRNEP